LAVRVDQFLVQQRQWVCARRNFAIVASAPGIALIAGD
jgi:hypothetical protein